MDAMRRNPEAEGDERRTGSRAASVGGCPAHARAACAPDGGAVSDRAAAFDAFEGPYQVDPADALRWARDEEPVFYSPRLGYWVVTRYADVRAVFRDPVLFSPRNALEKITPVSQEAQDVLASYGYAMNRTLVNEDEPAHMERRRLLLDHFLPEHLAAHEPMVRRLTEERIDAFVDRGHADLVEEMLWEVPLTVALHFLGVHEDDIAALKRFSVAHTVNTWGRPTPEQQVEVARAVGRFWQYAGTVLDRMRAEPDGAGWMHHAIRENARNPEIVTDSYLHSMMMAIIVAAHETTAHASSNAIKLLLTHGQAWTDVCEDPTLIPNAVEECLRYAGSVVAWRRQATDDTEVGGVPIPAGAKLLIVQASANRDERRFEGAETFDITRDDAVDHLTFGYGAHQCLGKNLARMEMRLFLEALTRRLPHMRLTEQSFEYLPNTSFRGPNHLRVEWDPARNPERSDSSRRAPRAAFEIGAPSRKDVSRPVRVAEVWREADEVLAVRLEDARGRPLPEWSAGAHVELCVGEVERAYSLCGPPGGESLTVAILREPGGRGGSRHLHEALRPGLTLRMRGPRNRFALDDQARRHVLVAGGIGITPILAMADRLRARGSDYAIHYAGRGRRAMAFLERLTRDHGDRLSLYPGDEGRRVDLAALMAEAGDGTQVYACGPDRMIAALRELAADMPGDVLRFEHFSSGGTGLDPSKERGFDVELIDSGLSLRVPADRTLLATLRKAGFDVASDCEEGLCGSCEVAVADGPVDHRDKVLSAREKAEGRRMMSCCSRARGGSRLKLAL